MATSDPSGFGPIERKVILVLLCLLVISQVIFLGLAIVMFMHYMDYGFWMRIMDYNDHVPRP